MKTIFHDQNKSKLQKWFWTSLMVIGWITIILMWTRAYTTTRLPSRISNFSDGGQDWYEKLILPFYFTHISNLMGALLGTIMFFEFNKKLKFINSFKIITFVNLSITMVIFFAVLLPKNPPKETFHWVQTLMAHLVVPLIMIITFLFNVLNENDFNWKVNIWLKAFLYIIFPLTWLAIAIIIYVGLNMRASAAIYGFLKFKQQTWYISVGWILGIGTFYYLLSLFATWLTVRKCN